MKYVRLKRYDPHHRVVLRRYWYKQYRFKESEGWYVVPDDVAEYLEENARQRAGDPMSIPAFDICTKEEAEEIDERENLQTEVRRPAQKARVYAEEKEEKSERSGLLRGRGRKAKQETKQEKPPVKSEEDSKTSDTVEETK